MSAFNIGITTNDYFAVTYNKKPIFSIGNNGKAYTSKFQIDGLKTKVPIPGTNYESKALGDWSLGHTSNDDLIFIYKKQIMAILTSTAQFYVGDTYLMPNPMSKVFNYDSIAKPLKFGNWAFGANQAEDVFLFTYNKQPVFRVPITGNPAISEVAYWSDLMLDSDDVTPTIGNVAVSLYDKVDKGTTGIISGAISGVAYPMTHLVGLFNSTDGQKFQDAVNGAAHFIASNVGTGVGDVVSGGKKIAQKTGHAFTTFGHQSKHFFTHTINPAHWHW